MATRGCATVSHVSTPYSAPHSAFSIKNILNLPEDTIEEHEKFPRGFEQANTYFSSSFPLLPRDEQPSFLNLPTCYPDLGITFGGVPYLQAVALVNQFPFQTYGSSFGARLSQGRRRRPLRKKKQRPLFSTNQIQTMENEFTKCRYVTESRRAELALDLNLTETQVKTWFQNRRTKWKKERREKGEQPSREVHGYCEGSIGHAMPEGHFSYYNKQHHRYPIAWNAPNSPNFPSQKSFFSW